MTSWTVAHQAPLYMGFSRQEYRNGLLCPPPGDLPNRGIKPRSPALQEDSLPSEPPGKPINGIVFPISFSDSSLLVYRKIANFYIFTLYPATLPNSLISDKGLLVESLEFSIHALILFADKIILFSEWKIKSIFIFCFFVLPNFFFFVFLCIA